MSCRCLAPPPDADKVGGVHTGHWHTRTLQSEKLRTGPPNVRLLCLQVFVDGTNLDSVSRNTATPTVVGLLNWDFSVLRSDAGKKLVGFFPDIKTTKAQRKKKGLRKWIRQVNSLVLKKFVGEIKKVCDAGGV